MRNAKGFTLIELVMVIVILGILAAVAIPRFSDMSNSARKASFKGAVGAVKSGVVAYLGQNQKYPSQANTFTNNPEEIMTSDDFTLTTSDPTNTDLLSSETFSTGAPADSSVYLTDGTYQIELRYDGSTGIVYAPTELNQ